MTSALSSIATSGMNAAMLRMDASGHNIANAMTPGFRRQEVAQEARPEGGVRATLTQAAQPGEALAEDIVQQLASSYSFKANVLSLRTGQDMLGSLLDLHA